VTKLTACHFSFSSSAMPKAILNYMNNPIVIPGLTRANISSHLQKYRKKIANNKKKRLSNNNENSNSSNDTEDDEEELGLGEEEVGDQYHNFYLALDLE